MFCTSAPPFSLFFCCSCCCFSFLICVMYFSFSFSRCCCRCRFGHRFAGRLYRRRWAQNAARVNRFTKSSRLTDRRRRRSRLGSHSQPLPLVTLPSLLPGAAACCFCCCRRFCLRHLTLGTAAAVSLSWRYACPCPCPSSPLPCHYTPYTISLLSLSFSPLSPYSHVASSAFLITAAFVTSHTCWHPF